LFYVRQPVAGADAIAEYENHRGFGLRRSGCNDQDDKGKQPFHERS
jgi:hypothetical protein